MIIELLSIGQIGLLAGIFHRLGSVRSDIDALQNRADRQLQRIQKIEGDN